VPDENTVTQDTSSPPGDGGNANLGGSFDALGTEDQNDIPTIEFLQ